MRVTSAIAVVFVMVVSDGSSPGGLAANEHTPLPASPSPAEPRSTIDSGFQSQSSNGCVLGDTERCLNPGTIGSSTKVVIGRVRDRMTHRDVWSTPDGKVAVMRRITLSASTGTSQRRPVMRV